MEGFGLAMRDAIIVLTFLFSGEVLAQEGAVQVRFRVDKEDSVNCSLLVIVEGDTLETARDSLLMFRPHKCSKLFVRVNNKRYLISRDRTVLDSILCENVHYDGWSFIDLTLIDKGESLLFLFTNACVLGGGFGFNISKIEGK